MQFHHNGNAEARFAVHGCMLLLYRRCHGGDTQLASTDCFYISKASFVAWAGKVLVQPYAGVERRARQNTFCQLSEPLGVRPRAATSML